MPDGCAPRWDGRRLDFDWSAWDRRFGPLLDGSAFADLPRKGVPLELLLPAAARELAEPDGGQLQRRLLGRPRLPRVVSPGVRRGLATDRRALPSQGLERDVVPGLPQQQGRLQGPRLVARVVPLAPGRAGQLPGLLGPPLLRRAFHEGINQAFGSPAAPGSVKSPRLVFRADISRPQWRRDSLDGLLDYHVVGGAMRAYPRLVFDRKRTLGEIVLEYGSTNPVEGSNLQPVGWCLDAWSLGTDGVIPWQTIGNADSWERADELSLFYPARARTRGQRGSNRSDAGGGLADPVDPAQGVSPRPAGRGVPDALVTWRNQPRWAVGRQVRAALNLAGTRQGTGLAATRTPAGSTTPGCARRDLWTFAQPIGEALSQAHPAFESKLVDFRTPRRDPNHLPSAYVGAHSAD